MSKPERGPSQVKQRARGILKGIALVIVAVIVAGLVYEQLGEWQDRERFPQIGKSVDIGGRGLNIYCSGEGSPTVVFDSKVNLPGYEWALVQPKVANFTRACWYDRAGHGWSDPGPFPRTSAAIANDLHALLRAAAVPPPYVLVGFSFGGFNVRVFAGKYPPEVAGMVLVFPWHENAPPAPTPESLKGPVDRMPGAVRAVFYELVPMASRIGLFRAINHSGIYMPSAVPADQRAILQALCLQSKFVAATSSEQENFEEDAAQVRAAGNLGDRPLIVLNPGQWYSPPDAVGARDAAAWHELWIRELGPQLARLSSRGRQVIVNNSGYFVPHEAPDVVVEAVREVVTEVRAEQPK